MTFPTTAMNASWRIISNAILESQPFLAIISPFRIDFKKLASMLHKILMPKGFSNIATNQKQPMVVIDPAINAPQNPSLDKNHGNRANIGRVGMTYQNV